MECITFGAHGIVVRTRGAMQVSLLKKFTPNVSIFPVLCVDSLVHAVPIGFVMFDIRRPV